MSAGSSPGPNEGWRRICRVAELSGDAAVGRVIGDPGPDQDRVCVAVRRDGEIVALRNRCPHRDLALSGGVVRDGLLTCPGHFWRFDLSTGERTDLPDQRLTLYPTRVLDGWVEAQLPPPGPKQSMRQFLLAEARRRAEDG